MLTGWLSRKIQLPTVVLPCMVVNKVQVEMVEYLGMKTMGHEDRSAEDKDEHPQEDNTQDCPFFSSVTKVTMVVQQQAEAPYYAWNPMKSS